METVPNPFEFVGQFGVMNEGNALNYMRARYYNPGLGRFSSNDPLSLSAGDLNTLRYVWNDPVNCNDPAGLRSEDIRWRIIHILEGAELIAIVLAPETGGVDLLVAAGLGGLVAVTKHSVDSTNQQPAGNYNDPNQPGYYNDPNQPGYYNDPDHRQPGYYNDPNHRQPGYYNDPNHRPPGYYNDPTPPSNPTGAGGTSTVVTSQDPNAMYGPAGYGSQGFIADAASPLPYRVDFENDPTATAPAQEVTVTDQLDPSLDWKTLQFTAVGFGDNIITIPANTQHYQTTVPMTYNGQTFDVDIELGLNCRHGPGLRPLPVDRPEHEPAARTCLTGFLPPEDGTGRGQGYFSYTVQPKAGLPTGTQIRNVALVTFDASPSHRHRSGRSRTTRARASIRPRSASARSTPWRPPAASPHCRPPKPRRASR